MLCQKCLKKQATVKIAQIISGKQKEIYLCEECALSMGFDNAMKQLPKLFNNLMLDVSEKDLAITERHPSIMKCPSCGATWDEFKRTGLLGCDKCYDVFHDQIVKVLKQIHGNARHIGSRPVSQRKPIIQNLSKLKEALKKSIANEEFEKAARLRDQIRELQGKVSKN
ncbi:UvrB/uvrC motif protein [bacterium BMS3Abin05]|nr:UvrB/uvrC motif protein [bacterium BMS3Abin05]GBE27376.1 UvrB/uvrC motif protein [bacterium BMS3Bbin03]HDZ12705.1 DNA helicase UvrBC [Bacteroidota bacterium]